MLGKLLLLSIAGGAGALARYFVSGLAQRVGGSSFPWGTLTVNMLGCFLFGFVWSLAEDRLIISNESRFIILTGFMGAFTTFSTFAFESAQMIRDGQWGLVFVNLAAQNLIGVIFILAGLKLGRLL
jgi:CrcB protein